MNDMVKQLKVQSICITSCYIIICIMIMQYAYCLTVFKIAPQSHPKTLCLNLEDMVTSEFYREHGLTGA